MSFNPINPKNTISRTIAGRTTNISVGDSVTPNNRLVTDFSGRGNISTNASDRISKLNNASNSGGVVSKISYAKYPEDLFSEQKEGNFSYCLFDIYTSVQKPTYLASVALYMPPSIKVSYGAQWEEIGFELPRAGDALRTARDTIGDSITNRDPSILKAALAAFGLNTIDQINTERGQIVNPHQALTYKGPTFRTFNLDFQLMARSEKESNSIQDIIQIFKSSMHPGLAGAGEGSTWSYPHHLKVSFFSQPGNDNYLFKLADCIVSDMSVDYAPDQVSFFRTTGAPVDVRLNITLKERHLLTREKIDQNY